MNVKIDDSDKKVFTMVPVFNHGPFLEQCLRSIFDQTLSPKKLLVIDDGSSDDSAAVAERVLKDCPFDSELIVRENRGLCATLNQGLSLSSGEYFAYIGSDDYWLPNFIEERVKLMNRRKDAVIGYGHAFYIDENDKILLDSTDHTNDWAEFVDGDPRDMLLKVIVPISSTVFYRRSALEDVSWNEGSRLEDFEMYLHLMEKGAFAFDPQTLSVWRDHSYNTSKDLSAMMGEVFSAQDRHMDRFGRTPDEVWEARLKTKFRYARVLLQDGFKSESLRFARESWRGADSIAQLMTFGVRLCVPMFVVNAKRHLTPKR